MTNNKNLSSTKIAEVLLIDDDTELQKILHSTFTPMNIHLTSISTGSEALKLIENPKQLGEISLVIIERNLPDMEGLEILDTLIKRYQHKVPILILSSLTSEEDVIEGLHRGAVEYITKPFNLKVLVEKIHSLVTWKESE